MTHVLHITAPKYTAAVLVIALLIHVSSLTAAEPSVHSEHVAGNVLHMGDLMFEGIYPFIDLLNPEHPPSAPRAESHAPRS